MSDPERIARLEEAQEANVRTFDRIEKQYVETTTQLGGISRHLAHQEGAFAAVQEDVSAIKASALTMSQAADQVVRATNGGVWGAAQRAAMPVAGGGAVFGLVEFLRAAGLITGGG